MGARGDGGGCVWEEGRGTSGDEGAVRERKGSLPRKSML